MGLPITRDGSALFVFVAGGFLSAAVSSFRNRRRLKVPSLASPHVRRIFLLGSALLGLHILLFFLLAGYRDLALQVGLFFTYGNDISDLLRVGGTGFAVLALAVVGAGVLVDLILRRLWQWIQGEE